MSVIVVNESAPYKPGMHNHYGPNFMAEISAATARKLCGMYPMPEMGHEIVVGIAEGARLHVANISGAYFICSTDVAIEDWPTEFGVTLKRKETAREQTN
jgi:hypothetical protein